MSQILEQMSSPNSKEGHFMSKNLLIATYSKRECVFYQIKIQQRVSTGKPTQWKTLVEMEHM